jgi:hypothetical protein
MESIFTRLRFLRYIDVIFGLGGGNFQRRTHGRSPGRANSANNMPFFSQFYAQFENTTQNIKNYDIIHRDLA